MIIPLIDLMEEGELTTGGLRIAGLCKVCLQTDSRYRCPGCSVTYCSLSCSRHHKQQSDCTGRRSDRSYKKFIPLKGLTSEILTDDLALLEETLSAIRNQPAVLSSQQKQHQNRQHHNHHTHNRSRYTPMRNGRLRAACKDRNIRYAELSSGMIRTRQNKSLVSSDGFIKWTVEWLVVKRSTLPDHPLNMSPQSLRPFIVSASYSLCHENHHIMDVCPRNLISESLKDAEFFLRSELPPTHLDESTDNPNQNNHILDAIEGRNSRRLWQIHSPQDTSLALLLAHRQIIEFPTIYVVITTD